MAEGLCWPPGLPRLMALWHQVKLLLERGQAVTFAACEFGPVQGFREKDWSLILSYTLL